MSWLVGSSTKETILSFYKYHYYIVFLVTFGTHCRIVFVDVFDVCVFVLMLSFALMHTQYTRLHHTQDPFCISLLYVVVAFSVNSMFKLIENQMQSHRIFPHNNGTRGVKNQNMYVLSRVPNTPEHCFVQQIYMIHLQLYSAYILMLNPLDST